MPLKLSLLVLCCLAVAGCGGSPATAGPSGASSGVGRVEIRHPLQRALSEDVEVLLVTPRDVRGTTLQEPAPFPVRPFVELTVPRETASLEILYLGPGLQPRGSYVTPLDPLVNPVTVLEDPAWVEEESLDPTVFRFAWFGCNRLGSDDLTDDNPSSANLGQLLQDFSELPRVTPPLKYLLFAGDLVMNQEKGTATLQSQLDAWLQVYQASDLASSAVTLVPFTGNHEILEKKKDKETGEKVEVPNPPTLPVWVSTMGAFLRGSDGPTTAAPNADGLTQDQSQLSYTFRDGSNEFIVLNTDTFIDDTTTGDVPLNWLQEKLDQAQADPTVDNVFVLGHKPIEAPPTGDTPIRPEEAGPMEQMLAANPKVRGYFCAHAHSWESMTLSSGVRQVVGGNGGSPLDPGFNDTGKGWFGYTLLSLHASGRIHVEAWGRPIPDPYDAPAPQPESTLHFKQLL